MNSWSQDKAINNITASMNVSSFPRSYSKMTSSSCLPTRDDRLFLTKIQMGISIELNWLFSYENCVMSPTAARQINISDPWHPHASLASVKLVVSLLRFPWRTRALISVAGPSWPTAGSWPLHTALHHSQSTPLTYPGTFFLSVLQFTGEFSLSWI